MTEKRRVTGYIPIDVHDRLRAFADSHYPKLSESTAVALLLSIALDPDRSLPSIPAGDTTAYEGSDLAGRVEAIEATLDRLSCDMTTQDESTDRPFLDALVLDTLASQIAALDRTVGEILDRQNHAGQRAIGFMERLEAIEGFLGGLSCQLTANQSDVKSEVSEFPAIGGKLPTAPNPGDDIRISAVSPSLPGECHDGGNSCLRPFADSSAIKSEVSARGVAGNDTLLPATTEPAPGNVFLNPEENVPDRHINAEPAPSNVSPNPAETTRKAGDFSEGPQKKLRERSPSESRTEGERAIESITAEVDAISAGTELTRPQLLEILGTTDTSIRRWDGGTLPKPGTRTAEIHRLYQHFEPIGERFVEEVDKNGTRNRRKKSFYRKR